MILDLFRLVGLIIGHACVVVIAVNMLHGFGVRGHWPNRITYTLLPVMGLAGVVLAVSCLRGHWSYWPWPVQGYAYGCVALGLVGLPATTLKRALRGPLEGIVGSTAEIDMVAEHGMDQLAGAGWRGRLLRARWNDSLRLKTHEWRLEIPGLPAELDGLSLIHLTDLHMAPCYRREFFEAVLDEASRWDADLVLYTGDLIEDDATLEWVAPLLSRVRGRLATVAILGNHDLFYDVTALRQELARAAVQDLDGRWATIAIGDHRLAIGGTSAPWGPPLSFDPAPEASVRIVMSHTPDLFPHLARRGIDLVLSGHNHGGQFRLPVLGPILMPSRFSRRYDEGFFRSGDSLLYVNRGIGGDKPIRYRCPIEIARLVLRSPSRVQRDGADHERESLAGSV